MKTVNDFKVVNGVAVLEGVAYAEEAKVVDEFLKNNTKIQYASVKTKDGRYFELKNSKLVISKNESFVNPHYVQTLENVNRPIPSVDINKSNSLEQRVISLESKLNETKEILNGIITLLKTYVDKK